MFQSKIIGILQYKTIYVVKIPENVHLCSNFYNETKRFQIGMKIFKYIFPLPQ